MLRRRRRGHTEAAADPRRPEPLVSKRGQRRGNGRRGRRGEGANGGEPTRRSKAARHPVVLMANLILLLFVMVLVGGVATLVIGRQMFVAQGPLNQDMGIIIESGSSLPDIALGLQEQGIIDSRYVFMAGTLAAGAGGAIQAGEYRIPAGSSMADVLARLQSGQVIQHRLTIPEGLTSAQVVARLQENEILTGPIEGVPPEGALLPETYTFGRGMTRQRLLNLMRSERDRVVEEVWAGRDPELPLESPAQLVNLASIVEKETGVAGERARVAGVFVNRLNEGMRLQSDPTILYGLYGGEAWDRPRTIYRSDLQQPNSYNTYQIDGLPPGPIANPGRAALEATANPEETDERFFVADGTGGHVFAITYEEHQRNVARWREIERERAGAPDGNGG